MANGCAGMREEWDSKPTGRCEEEILPQTLPGYLSYRARTAALPPGSLWPAFTPFRRAGRPGHDGRPASAASWRSR